MVIGFAVLGKLLVMLVLREPPRMSPPGTPRTDRSRSGESDHWFSADPACCVPPDRARLLWAPTESDFPQAAVMFAFKG
jgi:hypothetical protein